MPANPSHADGADDPLVLTVWRGGERVLLAIGAANLVLALVVGIGGGGLHPLFSDPDAAWLFVVTGLGLIAHAVLLWLLRWRLWATASAATRPLRHLRAFMRLPIHADFSDQRACARLRSRRRERARRPVRAGAGPQRA